MSKQLRVLLVEDSEKDAELISMLLRKEGYSLITKRVDKASDMAGALNGNHWDVILSDFAMPSFSGFDALMLLHKTAIDIPFIVISGAIGEEKAAALMKAGACDYINKNNLSRLGPTIERELRETKSRQERKHMEGQLQESFERTQKTLKAIIYVLISTVELRDPYTAGHQMNVANLARAIALEMGLDNNHAEGVFLAGAVHDLGKLGTPTAVLAKIEKLSDIEFAMIKNHSQYAYEILKNVDFPWPISQIILQHHERVNGSGYPQGLSGDNILLEARIVGLADVVEVMATPRPYRPALGVDKALEEITKNSGILYDAKVVDACLRLFKEKGFKFA